MITEDYVSFETAKLLKEKGFDSECDYLYVNGDIVRAQGGKCNWNKGETIFTDYKNECSAPTLQMAMKWLREVHNIAIETEWEHLWYAYIKPMTSKPSEQDYYQCESSKYEEACEEAIKHYLESFDF